MMVSNIDRHTGDASTGRSSAKPRFKTDNYGYALEDLPLFEGFTPGELAPFETGLTFSLIKKGQFIFKTGDSADQLYVVCEGHIKIYYNTAEGKEQIMYVYSDGDFVGGLNILEDDDYRYMGEALSDSVVATIRKDVFLSHACTNPVVLRRMLSKCYERIRWAEELIGRLSASNAQMKAAGLLLALRDDFGTVTSDGVRLELPMNREEMGSYAGLTRETMTRKLSEFKESGYIEFDGTRVIIIKDVDALIQFSF